jgi:hypothetical protein
MTSDSNCDYSADNKHYDKMTDYSRFGIPSREWQEHVEKFGPAPDTPIGKMPAVAIQQSTNASREEVSAQQMKAEGKNWAIANCDSELKTDMEFRSLLQSRNADYSHTRT